MSHRATCEAERERGVIWWALATVISAQQIATLAPRRDRQSAKAQPWRSGITHPPHCARRAIDRRFDIG